MSIAMLYLAAGLLLGPLGWAALTPHPLEDAALLERAAEVAVLISLFSVGLKLGLPLSNRHWLLPLRLAFVSMTVTVGLIAVAAVWLALSLVGWAHWAWSSFAAGYPFRPKAVLSLDEETQRSLERKGPRTESLIPGKPEPGWVLLISHECLDPGSGAQ